MGREDQISYVWVNFGVCLIVLVSFIFFVLNSLEQSHSIWKYHDTISSFCAKQNSWENKFLLFFSTVISFNLTFLHFEEFNSRHDEQTDMDKLLFGVEIVAISMFMLVGILYVPGRNPETANKDYDVGNKWCRCSIVISSWVHSIFALLFMFVLTTVNTMYAHQRWNNCKDPSEQCTPWAVVTCIWALFSIVVGTIFIAVQGVLYCYDHLVLDDDPISEISGANPIRNAGMVRKSDLEDPDYHSDGTDDMASGLPEKSPPPQLQRVDGMSSTDWIRGIAIRLLAERLQIVRVTSFVLEIVWVTSIVLQDGVCSVYRNKLFPYFGKELIC